MTGDGEQPGALLEAAVAAHRAGRPEAAIPLYEAALAQFEDAPARHTIGLWLAGALCDAEQKADAAEACRAAIAADPTRAAGHAMLAGILLDLGRLDEAAAAADQALAPGDRVTLNLATGIALARGDAERAARLAATCLAEAPTDQRALSHRIVALAQRGTDTELAALLDFDRLLRVVSVGPPPGFASIEAFNAALSQAIRSSDLLDRRHIGKTMVGGLRLHDSFTLAPGLADALRALFLGEIRAYAAALAVAYDHPVRRGRPSEPWTLECWSNIMERADYELPHIHDGSWLSAVYYPEMPEPRGDEGAIEFGGHDLGPALVEGPTRRIRPRPGMMVLFPAYFYHRTMPFEGTGRRISIACDVRLASAGEIGGER
jgi:hypothetical protein